MSILICAACPEHDHCISTVTTELEALGQEVNVFETGRFPAEINLSLDPSRSTRIISPGQIIDLDSIQAVWSRHIDVGLVGLEDLRDDHRSAVQVQASHTLHNVLDNLKVFQLDPQSALSATPSKAGQLRLAEYCGFQIPKTLISNDPDQVRRWADALESKVLVKMVDSGSIGFDHGNGFEPYYAQTLSEAELADLDGLRWCPMVFQEQIDKKLELRITVVGDQIFTAAIDSTQSSSGSTDWRKDGNLSSKFQRFVLPKPLEANVKQLVRRLGLQFATLDVILTPDDQYVFLEANSVSFFDFIEESTGLPISRAIAELIIEKKGRLPSPCSYADYRCNAS